MHMCIYIYICTCLSLTLLYIIHTYTCVCIYIYIYIYIHKLSCERGLLKPRPSATSTLRIGTSLSRSLHKTNLYVLRGTKEVPRKGG